MCDAVTGQSAKRRRATEAGDLFLVLDDRRQLSLSPSLCRSAAPSPGTHATGCHARLAPQPAVVRRRRVTQWRVVDAVLMAEAIGTPSGARLRACPTPSRTAAQLTLARQVATLLRWIVLLPSDVARFRRACASTGQALLLAAIRGHY
jgi:hypothetical protein